MGPATDAVVHAVRTEDVDPARLADLGACDVLFIERTTPLARAMMRRISFWRSCLA